MSCADNNATTNTNAYADAIHYFIDGSCIGNGAGDPVERSAAYAVVKAFAQQFVEQHAEAIDRSLPQTNQDAELVAFQYAFTDIETKHADQQAGNPITIYSDSMYAINCITTWGPLWKVQGWKRKARGSGGKPLEHIHIIAPLVDFWERHQDHITITHIPAHQLAAQSRIYPYSGNALADKLARAKAQGTQTDQ
jgi:ribonuclease HI